MSKAPESTAAEYMSAAMESRNIFTSLMPIDVNKFAF